MHHLHVEIVLVNLGSILRLSHRAWLELLEYCTLGRAV
jgi:hypothetical protein